MTANNKKYDCYFFLPKPSLRVHELHDHPFDLRTPLHRSKDMCIPNQQALLAPHIDFYLHPENQSHMNPFKILCIIFESDSRICQILIHARNIKVAHPVNKKLSFKD